jgi:hypothetical protein
MAAALPSTDALADLDHLHRMVETNEALTLQAIRQHERAEEAQSLNVQLRAEIEHTLSKPYTTTELLKMMQHVLSTAAPAAKPGAWMK